MDFCASIEHCVCQQGRLIVFTSYYQRRLSVGMFIEPTGYCYLLVCLFSPPVAVICWYVHKAHLLLLSVGMFIDPTGYCYLLVCLFSPPVAVICWYVHKAHLLLLSVGMFI